MPKTPKRELEEENGSGTVSKKRKRKHTDQNNTHEHVEKEITFNENGTEIDSVEDDNSGIIKKKTTKNKLHQNELSPTKSKKPSSPSVKKIVENIITNCTISDIELFNQAALQYNSSETSPDVVLEYLKCTTCCSELTTLLMKPELQSPEILKIFEALEQIFLRVAANLKQFETAATTLISEIMMNCQKRIYFMLGNKKSIVQKATLRLLISMVLLNRKTAQYVITGFNFMHPKILPYLNNTNIKDEQDVRTSYIMFLLSFLMSDNNSVILTLLQQKGLLNAVFYKLKHDKIATIDIFLSTILSKVVLNSNISKTIKISLLNDFTLKFVLELYQWEGPLTVKEQQLKKTKKKSSSEVKFTQVTLSEEQETVAKLAHNFMLSVCCSYKNGILFQDASCGTSGKNQNHLLTNILKAVKLPLETSYSEDLIVNILKAAPDQMKFYLLSVEHHHFKPRNTLPWHSMMNFICKVIENQNAFSVLLKCGLQPVQKLASIVSMLIIPPILTRDEITEALKHFLIRMRHNMLLFILTILKKVCELIDQIENRNKDLSFLPSNEVSTFVNFIRGSLTKIFPGPEIFHFCWEKARTYELHEQMKDDKNSKPKLGEVLKLDLPSISSLEHLQILNEVHLLLHKILPNSGYFPDLSYMLSHVQKMREGIDEDVFKAFKFKFIENLVHSESGSSFLSDMVIIKYDY